MNLPFEMMNRNQPRIGQQSAEERRRLGMHQSPVTRAQGRQKD
jgi:hypothetical protein